MILIFFLDSVYQRTIFIVYLTTQKTKQFNSKSDPYNVLSLYKRGIKNSFFCFFVCSLIKVGEVNMNLNSTPRRSYYKKNAATRTGDSVKFCIIYLIGKFYNSTLPFSISTLLYTLPHSISTLLLPNYYCSSSSKSILACWDSRYCFILSELTTFFPVCSSKASFATLATDPPLAAICACSLIV